MTTKYTQNFGLALPDFRQGPWHDLVNGDFTKIDSLLFGAMSQANVAPWANSTHYLTGVSLLDAIDATVWMCVIEHTSAATPTTFAQDRTAHPTYWTRLLTGFAPRGEWTQSTQYFPYDLAYDSDRGIMALCTVKHISTSTGSIVDDQANWAFLLDMSDVGVVTANAVSWSNAAHPNVPKDNVQDAIDYLETQIKALNQVNVDQGVRLDAIDTAISGLQTALTNLTNATLKVAGNQTTTGGFRPTAYNAGNVAGGFTPNAYNGNYQYFNNAGATTIAPPANDCAIDILVSNIPGASALSFSGYTVAPNSGDPYNATNGYRFMVSIRRIGGVSTHFVKALQ